jgi:hypothetical protein
MGAILEDLDHLLEARLAAHSQKDIGKIGARTSRIGNGQQSARPKSSSARAREERVDLGQGLGVLLERRRADDVL